MNSKVLQTGKPRNRTSPSPGAPGLEIAPQWTFSFVDTLPPSPVSCGSSCARLRISRTWFRTPSSAWSGDSPAGARNSQSRTGSCASRQIPDATTAGAMPSGVAGWLNRTMTPPPMALAALQPPRRRIPAPIPLQERRRMKSSNSLNACQRTTAPSSSCIISRDGISTKSRASSAGHILQQSSARGGRAADFAISSSSTTNHEIRTQFIPRTALG